MNGSALTMNDDERSVLADLKALKDSGKVKGIIVTINGANMPQVDFHQEFEVVKNLPSDEADGRSCLSIR